MAGFLPPIVCTLLADTAEFNASMDEAQAKMAETGAEGESSGGVMGSAWAKTGLVVGAAVVAVGVAATDLAMKYQASTASLAANAGISVAAANSIGSAFLSQAFQTTFSAQQTMTAYAGVSGQLGLMQGHALSAVQALGFMRNAQDLAEASGTSLGNATADLAKVMQAYGIPVSQAALASNVLFNAARDTGQAVDSLSQAMARARGSMGAAAPPLQVMGGLLVDLTAHGETGRQAMSALNSAFTGIISPSKAVTAAQAAMGVSFKTASGALMPMTAIFAELQPKLAGMSTTEAAATLKTLGFGSASTKLAATIQAGPAVLQKYIDSVSKTGSAQAAASKNSGTLEGQVKTLGSGFEDLLTKIGEFLIPILNTLVGVMLTVVNYFEKNRVAAVALGIGIGAIVAVLGTMAAIAAVSAVRTAAMTVATTAWGIATGVVNGIVSVATGIMAAFDAVMDANPIALVVIAIAALIAIGVLLITHWKQVIAIAGQVWKDVTTFFTNLWHDVVSIWNGIVNFLAGVWKDLVTGVTTAVTSVVHFFAQLPVTILHMLADAGTWLLKTGESLLKGMWSGIVTGAVAVWNWFTSLPGKILGLLGTALTWLYDVGKNVLQGLENGVLFIWTTVTSWFKAMGSTVTGWLSGAVTWLYTVGKNIIDGLLGGIKAAWNGVTTWIHNVPGEILNGIKGIFGIHSPSTEMAAIGSNIMLGLAQGIAGSTGAAVAAATTASLRVAAAIGTPVDGSLSLTATGTGSLLAHAQLAGASAGGGGGGRNITLNNTYNIPVTGDMSPQTADYVKKRLDEHSTDLVRQFRGGAALP